MKALSKEFFINKYPALEEIFKDTQTRYINLEDSIPVGTMEYIPLHYERIDGKELVERKRESAHFLLKSGKVVKDAVQKTRNFAQVSSKKPLIQNGEMLKTAMQRIGVTLQDIELIVIEYYTYNKYSLYKGDYTKYTVYVN